MIKEMKPLTMIETEKLVKENEGGNEELEKYFKKFSKLKEKDVKEMRKELEELNNHKIKNADIVKIIDLLPEDVSEVNKIFTDVSLEENEIKQITDIVKKYR
jgi:DNA-directed RNA polymerase subunit F